LRLAEGLDDDASFRDELGSADSFEDNRTEGLDDGTLDECKLGCAVEPDAEGLDDTPNELGFVDEADDG